MSAAGVTHLLASIADSIDARLIGDGEVVITGVSSLTEADASQITFAEDETRFRQAKSSRAAAVIVPEALADRVGELARPCLAAPQPRLAFARCLRLFAPSPRIPGGVSPRADIAADAVLEDGVTVMTGAAVQSGAVIETGTVLYPGVVVGADTVVGQRCVLHANVVLRERVRLGERVIVHPGAVIGADGYGYLTVAGRHEKIPQIGTVEIGDDVEIGANTTIDRGTCSPTRIGRGTKIDNLVQIGHNVQVGEDCLIMGLAGLAGSVRLGNNVTVAGMVGVKDHATIGDGAVVGGAAVVYGDIPAGAFYSGSPAQEHRSELRSQANLRRLPALSKQVRQLAARLDELQARVDAADPELVVCDPAFGLEGKQQSEDAPGER